MCIPRYLAGGHPEWRAPALCCAECGRCTSGNVTKLTRLPLVAAQRFEVLWILLEMRHKVASYTSYTQKEWQCQQLKTWPRRPRKPSRNRLGRVRSRQLEKDIDVRDFIQKQRHASTRVMNRSSRMRPTRRSTCGSTSTTTIWRWSASSVSKRRGHPHPGRHRRLPGPAISIPRRIDNVIVGLQTDAPLQAQP